MKIGFRWFGHKYDDIPLGYIRQIPGVTTVVATLMDKQAGEVWTSAEINEIYKSITENGMDMDVVESVNIHEDIKLGLDSREKYIDNYIETVNNLSDFGVKVICYNFMPVFDWLRTKLNKKLPDGSTVMAYDQSTIDLIRSPETLADDMQNNFDGFEMPGWEPERLKTLQTTIERYSDIGHEKLMDNLVYFLERIIPTCEKSDIKMAIHPDDPPWDIFGLPRVVNNLDNINKFLTAVDSEHNGITLCTGSLGSDPQNDIIDIIGNLCRKDRIHFAHLRNVKIEKHGFFEESSHLSSDGSYNMAGIIKALKDYGFDSYVRPDHGRMIWGETGRPGYGLYDRALGALYIKGILDTLHR